MGGTAKSSAIAINRKSRLEKLKTKHAERSRKLALYVPAPTAAVAYSVPVTTKQNGLSRPPMDKTAASGL